MHELGYAHSIEVWNKEDRLVGGIYGLGVGRVFFGESQFSAERDASKLASAVLDAHLAGWGFIFRDAKWMTSHHAQAGFKSASRNEFRLLLARYAQPPDRREGWDIDPCLIASI